MTILMILAMSYAPAWAKLPKANTFTCGINAYDRPNHPSWQASFKGGSTPFRVVEKVNKTITDDYTNGLSFQAVYDSKKDELRSSMMIDGVDYKNTEQQALEKIVDEFSWGDTRKIDTIWTPITGVKKTICARNYLFQANQTVIKGIEYELLCIIISAQPKEDCLPEVDF